jgi:hypothetical protein
MRESASVTTRSSAGNGGACSAPVASTKAAPYRAEALRRGWSTPGSSPRFPGYVVARRYAVSGTALSLISAGARPTVPPILLPLKITVKGAPSARRCQCRVVKRSALAVNLFGLHSGFRPWAAAVNAAELL